MKWPDETTISAAAETLAEKGVVQIADFLPTEEAQCLHDELQGLREWDLALTGPQGPVSIDAAECSAMSASQQARMMENLRRQSRQGFSFIYHRRDVVPGEQPVARSWGQWIGSDDFLGGMRLLTRDSQLQRADAQACQFRPGHFLRTHDDMYGGRDRRFAYVFNLTSRWQADWGGLLHLVDDDDRPGPVLLPAFNSLSMFRVPRGHFVSQVASYARVSRLSITGWLFA